MTVQTIIKRAIKRLELEGSMLTPDAYLQAFCKEAKKAGIVVEDCNKIDVFSRRLNTEFQKELANYNIKTLNEFIRFLVSRLNRTNSSVCSSKLEAQTELSKQILNVITKLDNKNATLLAKKNLSLLNNHTIGTHELNHYKQLWHNLTLSDDDILLEKFAYLITNSFIRSISNKNIPFIDNLIKKILDDPTVLKLDTIKNDIQQAIKLRVSSDKESLKEITNELEIILDRLSLRLIDMIGHSNSSNNEIKEIKSELEKYKDSDEFDFNLIHKKLYTFAVALEKNTELFVNDLKSHSSEVEIMAKKIEQLESELAKVKESSREDFLTKLYNRRALDEEFNLKEAEFKRYNHNYSIAIFDLDHFKSINDTYGHDAGDIVLSAFAKILKREARELDVVGRFGGEEFMVILSETPIDGAETFAQKVRQSVEKTKFIYKDTRINVTVSVGVSERARNLNLESLIKSADEALYEAKDNGRNRVVKK